MCNHYARLLIIYFANVGIEDAAHERKCRRAANAMYAHRETCSECLEWYRAVRVAVHRKGMHDRFEAQS